MDINQNSLPSKKENIQVLSVADLHKRSCFLQEKKKFGSAICIITESEFWMYILFYCYIRYIFQKFQIEIF